MEINIRKQDELFMSLVHFFVTKENYAPILVQGVKDEIWLENTTGPYYVIRINSNYIHNEEQFKFDQFKLKNILAQIRKKTMSFKVNALNINLNTNEGITIESVKNIDNIALKSIDEVKSSELINIFPNLKDDLLKNNGGLDLILNVTKDINEKTQKDNQKYEAIFTYKKPIMTYILIGICILMYLIEVIMAKNIMDIDIRTLLTLGGNFTPLLRNFQIYRLFTYMFLHGSFIHLLTNLYSLYVIGNAFEGKIGKYKFLSIYLISGVVGGLLSAGASGNVVSIGASGAIFGIMGALIYFGYCYRLYMKDALSKSIIPIIIINLGIGFFVSGIDIWCHVGGLVAGIFSAMLFGVTPEKRKNDQLNGGILLTIFTLFLIYLVYFR